MNGTLFMNTRWIGQKEGNVIISMVSDNLSIHTLGLTSRFPVLRQDAFD